MTRRLTVDLLPVLHPEGLEGGTALVIDVLRATTTATTFLECGAAGVVFAPSREAALAQRGRGAAEVLLAGERGGLRLDGFDLGNSPLEAAASPCQGRRAVMNTSNGTDAAHVVAAHAEQVMLACLRNAGAAARAAQASSGHVTIVCAGTDHQIGLDDAYTAGVLVRELLALDEWLLNDSAQLALALLERWPAPLDALQASSHGQRLLGLGDVNEAAEVLARDVLFCAEAGVSDCVPALSARGEGGGLLFTLLER